MAGKHRKPEKTPMGPQTTKMDKDLRDTPKESRLRIPLYLWGNAKPKKQ